MHAALPQPPLGRAGRAGARRREWAAHFCRFEPLPDNLPQPLALRYHGHQFRVYNPEIGDGRGFTFAQLRDDRDRLLDLGTKGSGQTPYSRHADGRLTLKGGVREVLATEMLEALGVNTSKSFALFETGEAAGARRRALADPLIGADAPQPRPHPHRHLPAPRLLRPGREHRQARPLLPREPLRRAAGADDAENALRLFDLVSAATAKLAASYIAAGFVHGVLNSDNINITGESFDYGPWRFTPDWDPEFTAAYFDHHGLYAFGRQPEAIHWDVAQLAGCLSLVAEAPPLSDLLAGWSERFEQALVEAMLRRLGVAPGDDDSELAAALIKALATRAQPIDRIFFDWRGGRDPGAEQYPGEEFRELARLLAGREAAADRMPYWSDAEPCSMHIEEVEAIWSAIAERDDWRPFEDKITAMRRMGEAMGAGCTGSLTKARR